MLEVVEVNIDTIKPYENNAKTHPPEQIAKICESIKLTGFDQPIVVDQNNVIIKGHGRRLAAIQLGLKTVPVVKIINKAEVVKTARILDNKAAESPWDIEVLLNELKGLDDFFTGFEASEIDSLIAQLEEFDEEFEEFDEEFEEFEANRDGSASGTGSLNYIQFGKHKIQLADDEFNKLEARLSSYQKKYGLDIGFVRWLLGDGNQ